MQTLDRIQRPVSEEPRDRLAADKARANEAIGNSAGGERFAEVTADGVVTARVEVAAAYERIDTPKTDGSTIDNAPRPGHAEVAKSLGVYLAQMREVMLSAKNDQ